MDLLDKLRGIEKRLATVADGQPMPGQTVIERVIGPCEVVVQGRPTLMFGSNNYLGLTLHPEVVDAARRAVVEYGTGTTGSRTANGTLAMHEHLEREFADWFGTRHAIIFSTGYQANLSVIGGLCGQGDVILIDSDSHASIYDATRQTASQVIGFRHNSPESLRKKLERLAGHDRNRLVVVEGLYSIHGDVAPLRDIVDVCRAHGAYLLVDEAHSLGTYGATGSGLRDRRHGIADRADSDQRRGAHDCALADAADVRSLRESHRAAGLSGRPVRAARELLGRAHNGAHHTRARHLRQRRRRARRHPRRVVLTAWEQARTTQKPRNPQRKHAGGFSACSASSAVNVVFLQKLFRPASQPSFFSIPLRGLRETLAQIDLRDDAEAIAKAIDAAHEAFRSHLGPASTVERQRPPAHRAGEVADRGGDAGDRGRNRHDRRAAADGGADALQNLARRDRLRVADEQRLAVSVAVDGRFDRADHVADVNHRVRGGRPSSQRQQAGPGEAKPLFR